MRDVRSDSQAKLHHMYSMIAVKAHIPPPTVDRFTPIDLEKIQRCVKRHIMDGDTAKERLDYLEPKIEDWHALQTFLMVR